MIDLALLHSLLSHNFYEQTEARLNPSLFDEECRELYEALEYAHGIYEHDISTRELFHVWRELNPVATRAETAEIQNTIAAVERTEPVSEDVAGDVIAGLWRRDVGKRIATLGLEISEGNTEALDRLRALLERDGDSFAPDDFGPSTTQDLDELLDELDDSSRFKFNIETLSRYVYGIGRQEFGIIFAVPETGKTAFGVSLACGPGGWVEQGAKVMFLGNEESTRRVVVRAFMAATGMNKDQIRADPEKAKAIYRARMGDRIDFRDTQEWDLSRIEAYIKHKQPDIVLIDQADKVQISGTYGSGHERLRELYRRLREAAKRHNCVIFGMSQASNDAKGRTRIDYNMMEGSKIGKAAEADLIIGIGRRDVGEDSDPDNARFLTLSKNKLNGWHGTVICNIQPEVSRYVE